MATDRYTVETDLMNSLAPNVAGLGNQQLPLNEVPRFDSIDMTALHAGIHGGYDQECRSRSVKAFNTYVYGNGAHEYPGGINALARQTERALTTATRSTIESSLAAAEEQGLSKRDAILKLEILNRYGFALDVPDSDVPPAVLAEISNTIRISKTSIHTLHEVQEKYRQLANEAQVQYRELKEVSIHYSWSGEKAQAVLRGQYLAAQAALVHAENLFDTSTDHSTVYNRPDETSLARTVGSQVLLISPGAKWYTGHSLGNGEYRQQSERFRTANGQTLELISYFDGDPTYAPLTPQIIASRQRRYTEEKLLTKEAGKDDGLHGPNVEIFALMDVQTGEPVASLRMIHARTLAEVRQLPSYKKCKDEDTFHASELAMFEESVAEHAGTVEIAALWKEKRYNVQAKIELYKYAIQRSIQRNELWFIGVVETELSSLLGTYGANVVRLIGDGTPIRGEGASEKVLITPAYIDPMKYFDGMMAEIDEAIATNDSKRRYSRGQLMWHFLAGLDRSLLPIATQLELEKREHGSVAA